MTSLGTVVVASQASDHGRGGLRVICSREAETRWGSDIVSDDPTPAQREAKAFAKTYKGYSRFMRSMRRLAHRDDWVPTPNQTVIILKIRSTVGINRQG